MKKYIFIFDIDQKIIIYLPKYDEKENTNLDNDNNFKIFILEILLVVFLLVGVALRFYFGKLKWDRNRKKRDNELNDDYKYIEKDKDNNSIN